MDLRIFAYHVEQICLQPVGSVFILCLDPDTNVAVQIKGEDNVRLNGRWVGNRQGAVAEYAKIAQNSYNSGLESLKESVRVQQRKEYHKCKGEYCEQCQG